MERWGQCGRRLVRWGMAAAVSLGLDATGVSAQNGWAHYGGDLGGSRYSAAAQINIDNVGDLEVAWTVRTGDLVGGPQPGDLQVEGCPACDLGAYKFEATPILVDGRMYLSTPLNRVVALDPATGTELWRFDPKIDLTLNRNEGFVSRGVTFWRAPSSASSCTDRLFFGTVDARLIALDANTGRLCTDFGRGGIVSLAGGVGRVQVGQYGVTSPPVVVSGVVVVGSSIGDNRRVDLEHGTVRGFDPITGAQLWDWDPIPRDPGAPGWDSWEPDAAAVTGGANAWAPMSADEGRGLVFVPTGSAAPDFYGGERKGSNLFANSVVALDVETGVPAWHYQVVHHDVWDYDVAAQPTLTTIEKDGRTIDIVVVTTKMGFVFVLDRDTGTPILPIEERPVPSSDVPGEATWPTQPFPVLPRPLHPLGMTEADVWGITPEDRAACTSAVEGLRNDGMFTPPSLQGTLLFPGNAGGVNWGGIAVDLERDLAFVNHNRLPFWVRLTERTRADRGNQRGTPYTMTRDMLLSPSGLPCVRPPWSLLSAVQLSTGEVLWEVPVGRVGQLEGVPGADEWGSPALGGPIATAGGLVFIAGALDNRIRAHDIGSGDVLWEAELPAGGQATPMTYTVEGRQYIVIAAGGHGQAGSKLGDHLVAFSLPR